MTLSIICNPSQQEVSLVTNGLWAHNAQFHPVDIRPFLVNFTDEQKNVCGGLVAQSWWGGLEIQYLWVAEQYRKKGVGRKLMEMAESEALQRECHMAYVDTFDFQAKRFYEKLGYVEYGSLDGYAHKFRRHYLVKHFTG